MFQNLQSRHLTNLSFIKLFDAKTRTALIATINQIRENAVQIVAS